MFPFPFSFLGSVVPDIPVDRIANTEAMSFNGTDTYIDAGDSNNFSFGNGESDSPFSICTWVNMNDATRFRIINKYNINSPKEWLFAVGGNDTLRLNLYDMSSQTYIGKKSTSTLTIYQGAWIHLACTYDGSANSSGIKLYLNGSQMNDASNDSGGYTAMENTTQPVLIGWQGNDYANGKIDEVAIFNTALSANKIQQIYDATAVVGGVPQTANLFTGGLSSSLVYWNRMGDS